MVATTISTCNWAPCTHAENGAGLIYNFFSRCTCSKHSTIIIKVKKKYSGPQIATLKHQTSKIIEEEQRLTNSLRCSTREFSNRANAITIKIPKAIPKTSPDRNAIFFKQKQKKEKEKGALPQSTMLDEYRKRNKED
jgi:hypothetical protein